MRVKLFGGVFLLCLSQILHAQKIKDFEIKSPDGAITVYVKTGEKLNWSVMHKGQQIIKPSSISLITRRR